MDSSSNDATITCTVGKWYYKRMSLMALLLAAGGFWFLYDGVVGYGKKNVIAIAEMAFKAGGDSVPWTEFLASSEPVKDAAPDEATLAVFHEAHTAAGQMTPWSDHALRSSFSDDGSKEPEVFAAFEAGGVIGANWQDYASLKGIPVDPKADDQVNIKRAYEAAGTKREWATYALTKKWASGEIKYHDKGSINEQKFIAGLLIGGSVLVLLTFLRNRNRRITSDSDSYTDEKGRRIAFADIFRIDKRKWDNKGLAYAFFRADGAEKKATLDDLKYIGAGEILERILNNFQGELLERVKDDDDEISAPSDEINASDEESLENEAKKS